MRLLLLSDRVPPATGGAGRVAWSLACGLRDLGHEVHLVTATAAPAAVNTRDGITVHPVHARVPDRWRAYGSLYNPSAVRQVRRILRQVKPEVVHAHNIHVDLSYGCLGAADRLRIPVIFTAHDVMSFAYEKLDHYVNPAVCPTQEPPDYRLPSLRNLRQSRWRYNPFRNPWIRRVLGTHVRMRVAVSDALRQALEANGLPGFRVVHNGIDGEMWEVNLEKRADVSMGSGIEGRKVVLLAGRVSDAKGGPQALDALAVLIQRVPDATLLVLSDRTFSTDQHPDLESDHVRRGGWLEGEDLAAAFALAHVVIFPSVYLDAFGLVSLEAMASHKPVVATCHGGAPEIVQDGVTGYIVNPYDTDAFAGKLAELLTHPDLQKRMGDAGYERFQSEFTLERFAQRMLAIYEEALG
jgi:glycosyltransferase involved in cell wall biosynthesis